MANETILNGYTIQIDNSGVGHNWRTVDQDDLPPDIAEEIAAEIDGGNESHGDYVATNGLHYRWFPVAAEKLANGEADDSDYEWIDR